MNESHPAYRAALRIDPIAAEFWQQHRTPTAGNRLREIAEIIDEESRTVDADARVLPEDAVWRLIHAIEDGDERMVVCNLTRELKEAMR